jgi:soluble lytic murein transglycosylase-like protein
MKLRVLIMLALWSIGVPQTTAAQVDVPSGYRRIATEYAIPPQLFYAMALTESGKAIDGHRELRPWPWTLNIRGRAHFFHQRHTAERALRRALAGGERLIDVGLMQVNWRYHAHRLRNPRVALDPYRNLRIAARILRECQQSRSDWWAAVGCYHAPSNATHAARYQARVRQHWRRIRRSG